MAWQVEPLRRPMARLHDRLRRRRPSSVCVFSASVGDAEILAAARSCLGAGSRSEIARDEGSADARLEQSTRSGATAPETPEGP